MPTIACSCCNASIEKHLSVTCSTCKKEFKHTCVGLTQAEVRIINVKGKNLSWNCVTCNSIGNDINSLKAVIISLQNEVRALKDSQSSSTSTNFNLEEVIEEVEERQRRKDNLIIFGIAEQTANLDRDARFKEDVSVVTGLIAEILPDFDLPNDPKVFRLGKFNPSHQKPRPIRIQLKESNVHAIIRSFSAMKKNNNNFKHISVSFDRTPKQLQYLNSLKTDIEARRRSGENNLKIKFVRGYPKIISEN